jgi:hypothetical protein
MKQQIAAGILAISMVGGVSTGVVAHQLDERSGGEPKAKPSATPTKKTEATTKAPKKAAPAPVQKTNDPPKEPVLQPVGTFQITPGGVGPVRLGMTKDQALETGYVEEGTIAPNCGTSVLQWKSDYQATLGLSTLDAGQVVGIGVKQPGPRTRSGLTIGSTYASVKAALGEGATPEAVGGQAGLFVSEGPNWLGFLFNSPPDTITDDATVTFIEIRQGAKPNLTPGGC